MSLSFVVPKTGTQPWPASRTKVQGAVKPLEVKFPVLPSTVAAGVAAATFATAVAVQSGRVSQKRAIFINTRAFENELGVQAPVVQLKCSHLTFLLKHRAGVLILLQDELQLHRVLQEM